MVASFEIGISTLFGKTRRALLGLLFGRATEAFHLREIARLTGAGMGPVQRELAALTKAGLVRRTTRANLVLFQANQESPIFSEIRSIVLKTSGAAALIRAALKPIESQIRSAAIFGSVARGAERATSDIDLLIISDALDLQTIVSALRPVQNALGREINPMLYRVDEFRSKLRLGHPFLARVLREPRLPLIGDVGESE